MIWESMPEKIKQRYSWKDGSLYIGKKEIANYYIKAVAYYESPSGREYVKVQYVIDELEEIYEDIIEFDENVFLSNTPPDVCKNKCIVTSKNQKRDIWVLLQRQLISREKDGWILDKLGWNRIENNWVYCMGHDVVAPTNFLEKVYVFPELENRFKISYVDNTSENDILNKIRELIFLKHPIICICLLYHVTSLLRQLFLQVGIEPQFVLYIYGKTSTFKTTTAKYFFDIYRKEIGKSVACADLSSSEVALESIISEFKDCAFILDDLSPSNTKAEMNKKTNRVNNLIRTVSNCEVRYVKLGNNVTGKEIQCSLVLTAEYLPVVHSVMNRTIILSSDEFPLNQNILNLYTKEPFLINNFTHEFLKWVVENTDKLQEWISECWEDVKDKNTFEGSLKRVNASLSILGISGEILRKYLREKGINTAQIVNIISEILNEILVSEKKQLEALNEKGESEIKISSIIIELIKNGNLKYINPIMTKHGTKCDYYFEKTKKYIFISTDYLEKKVNGLIKNKNLSKILIGKKLKSEGVLYLEDEKNVVKRGGVSYYKIDVKALIDFTGIDIYPVLFGEYF